MSPATAICWKKSTLYSSQLRNRAYTSNLVLNTLHTWTAPAPGSSGCILPWVRTAETRVGQRPLLMKIQFQRGVTFLATNLNAILHYNIVYLPPGIQVACFLVGLKKKVNCIISNGFCEDIVEPYDFRRFFRHSSNFFCLRNYK